MSRLRIPRGLRRRAIAFATAAITAVLGATLVFAPAAVAAGPSTSAAPTAAATAPPAKPSTAPVVPGSGPSSSAGQTLSFSVEPANSKGPDGRQDFDYHKETPGTMLSDYVAITDWSNIPYTFTVWGADAALSADGKITFPPLGSKMTDFGTWITLSQKTITIQPMTRVTIPFTIAIPADATPGDHTGGIIGTATVTAAGAGGDSLNVNHSISLPVHVDIPGSLAKFLQVKGLTVAYHDSWNPTGGGWTEVSYSVVNTGNVNMTGTENLSITGIFGITLASVRAPNLPAVLLPGQSFREHVRVPSIFPLSWMTAHVTLHPKRIGSNGTIEPDVIASATTSAGFWATPILLLLIIVVLGAGIWYARRYLQARRDLHEQELWLAMEQGRKIGVGSAGRSGSADASGGDGE